MIYMPVIMGWVIKNGNDDDDADDHRVDGIDEENDDLLPTQDSFLPSPWHAAGNRSNVSLGRSWCITKLCRGYRCQVP